MGRTMSLLRALLGNARTVRPGQPPRDGLPPDGSVLLDAPDDRLGPALVAAALGDHIPAARLLAATRHAAEWEYRDRYAVRLAAFAHSREDWLAAWRARAPDDPDALLVAAQLAVDRAWESPVRAERLREVEPMVHAAAEMAPRDPVPWRIALDHARGSRAPDALFEALWEQAVRRSSHHHGCHVSALEYLWARCYGSHRACFDFAEAAALDSLPGSLVRALPLRAAYAQLVSGDGNGVPGARLDAAADLAVELSARYPVGDPWPAEVRNLLAYVLMARQRWTAALEQFRLIGARATSYPWSATAGEGGDPLGRFLEARDMTRRASVRRHR
ncbi:hypothetical protein RND61_05395 [Streptomyces sp. TRM76323]|uniref:DUF4034 domain-containing protein n=2 Tax=Streptomyces tamarix TaxID=3078565 RepID=A0ABU3QFF7_9ACTN|nr:hypothetical protein [Streptomyces tamarix]MDT9681510.1 hypothetical protein [Streptomyces tamarix]